MIHIFLLLLLFSFSACQPNIETQPADGTPSVFAMRGEVVGTLYKGQVLRINHEALAGQMEAMQMDFRLEEGTSAEGIKRGDKIAFDLVASESAMLIRNLTPLPDSTELVLGYMP